MGMISRTMKKIFVSLFVIILFAGSYFVGNLDRVISGEIGIVTGIKESFVTGANHATVKSPQYLLNGISYFSIGQPVAGIFYGFLPFLLIWGFWYLWISIFFDIIDMNKNETVPHSVVLIVSLLIMFLISFIIGGFEKVNNVVNITTYGTIVNGTEMLNKTLL